MSKQSPQVRLQVTTLFRRATAAFDRGDYAEALRGCEEVLGLDKKHALAWALMGQILMWRSQFENAATCLTRSLSINRTEARVRCLLGQLHLTTSRHDKALQE